MTFITQDTLKRLMKKYGPPVLLLIISLAWWVFGGGENAPTPDTPRVAGNTPPLTPPPAPTTTFAHGWLLWLLGATAVVIASEFIIKHFALDGRVRYATYGLAGVLALTGTGQLLGGANPFTGWLTPFMYRGEVQWPQVIGALIILSVAGFGAWDMMKDKSSRQTSRRVATALAVGIVLFGLGDWLLDSHVLDLLIEYVRGEAQTVVLDRVITNRWEWWHLGALLGAAFALWAVFTNGWLRALLVVATVIIVLGAGLIHFKDEIVGARDAVREIGVPWAANSPATPRCPAVVHDASRLLDVNAGFTGNCPSVEVSDNAQISFIPGQVFVREVTGNWVVANGDMWDWFSCRITRGNPGVGPRRMTIQLLPQVVEARGADLEVKLELVSNEVDPWEQQMYCPRW